MTRHAREGETTLWLKYRWYTERIAQHGTSPHHPPTTETYGITLLASTVCRILDRTCRHSHPATYHCQKNGEVWWGNELIWKTGGDVVIDYCRQVYQADAREQPVGQVEMFGR